MASMTEYETFSLIFFKTLNKREYDACTQCLVNIFYNDLNYISKSLH